MMDKAEDTSQMLVGTHICQFVFAVEVYHKHGDREFSVSAVLVDFQHTIAYYQKPEQTLKVKGEDKISWRVVVLKYIPCVFQNK